jgi:hypothetical protein
MKFKSESLRPGGFIINPMSVIGIVALLFWWCPDELPASAEQQQAIVPPTNAPAMANRPVIVPMSANRQQVLITNRPSLTEMIDQEVEARNKPVDFYGIVIDQNSNAISGVKIKSGVRHWKNVGPEFGYVGATNIQLDTTTGVDGRFKLTGASGDVFGVLLYKDGYEAESEKNGFSAATRDDANPIVFKMWKFGKEAELVTGSKFWGIVPDGRVYTIDFLQGTKTESPNAKGDIQISIVRPSQIAPRTKFNWSFSIKAMSGGLIETHDPFMYLAPEQGYQSSYQFNIDSASVDWKRELGGLQFYLKSQNGQLYGRFTFDLIPDYRDVGIFRVNWSVNPTGSRNLEPAQ